MRKLIAFAAAASALALTAPATADDHTMDGDLAGVLAADLRDDDRARDQYRHPAETLEFFKVKPDMTVVEWAPGGGWYTRVLAPYLMASGDYIAINGNSDGQEYSSRAREARALGWTENFKSTYGEALGVDADAINAYEIDEVPEEVAGTVDRVVIFRSMHGLNIGNSADTVLKGLRGLLADDGMVGVVQHRAPRRGKL